MNMKQIRAFLDSSVIISGLASRSGGSYKILALAELGIVIPCISETVVAEVLRNVKKKLPECLDLFYVLFKKLPFKIYVPGKNDLAHAESLINAKDAPILAAAITGRVDWLISLDKHFLEKTWHDKVDFLIGTPQGFLTSFPDRFNL